MIVELQSFVADRVKASPAQIAEFCQRWGIVELALLGSVLRDDFRPDSNIDVLVTFAPEQRFTWDDWLTGRRKLKRYSIVKMSAVERKFEVLEEAARRISDEFRQTHAAID